MLENRIVDLLNEMLMKDPTAVLELINHKIYVNNIDYFESHRNIQCKTVDKKGTTYIGVLGFLNGLSNDKLIVAYGTIEKVSSTQTKLSKIEKFGLISREDYDSD